MKGVKPLENIQLPDLIVDITGRLEEAGFENYIVGGAVRDLLLGKNAEEILDWDIATDAKPQDIANIFPEHSGYEDKFGTVALVQKRQEQENLEVHITPYRKEGRYGDYRHPEKVEWADSLKEDLKRRDFTINAIALNLKHEARSTKSETSTNDKNLNDKKVSNFEFRISEFVLVDPFNGQNDLENKLIRAVGDSTDRFQEDALRMMRAVRFATVLQFSIEADTKVAVQENAQLLKEISKERVREELVKMIMSDQPQEGVRLLDDVDLLGIILPELKKTQGIEQSPPHKYDLYEHSLASLQKSAQYNQKLELRLAALFHDIGKALTQGWNKEKGKYTFYNHAPVGAQLAFKILKRLKFSNQVIDKVYHLIYHHMFYYDVGEVTESAVRRLLRRVGGWENFQDLMSLRIVDRKAIPVPKAKPYKLRHLEFMMEKVSQDPVTVQQLQIDGNEIMEILDIQPGPRVGLILEALLAEVIDDPQKNTAEYLAQRAQELSKLTNEELRVKGARVEQEREQRVQQLKQKYWVK